jgi:DNA-binding NarL/FixJ family response regulator
MDIKSLRFNQQERRDVSVLVVEQDSVMRGAIRRAMTELAFGAVSDAPSHLLALDKLKERGFTHVLFDARPTNMTPMAFLRNSLELDSRLIALASSADPSIDDVFDLLMEGARGFVVKPPTGNTLEESMVLATKTEIIPDTIFYAADRNQALAAMVVTALDKVATLRRQAAKYETAGMELRKAERSLWRAAELARTFARGGRSELSQAIIDVCIDRGNGPASRLGRARRRLQKRNRVAKHQGTERTEPE